MGASKAELHLGDCRAIMPKLAASSVDAVVTDPPYEYNFMGKKWDKTGVSFKFGTWAAVLRVAKPGAHLLAFGGTRTYHRLVCAVEDGGWEIRDCLMWIYGCLSEDSEILTENGWEPYHRAIAGKRVIAYNIDDDTFEWQAIQEVFVYDYRDTAFRIRSDHTDQLISRNHRCLVERGGNYVFEIAEQAARQRAARVPVLEDVRGLLEALPLPYQRTGDAQQDVLPDVCRDADRCGGHGPNQGRSAPHQHHVPGMRSRGTETEGLGQTCRDSDLLARMQWRSEGTSFGQACLQGAGGLDRRELGIVSGENDRGEQPCLEGRGHDLPETRKLRRSPLRPLPIGVHRDGTQGWLRDGTSAVRRPSIGALSAEDGSRSSYQSRSDRQQFEQPAAVRQQSRPQTVRASRFARSDLAVIEPVFYEGIVWCVRVPSGAFIARRNGKVFVTGNSGFPKSLDVSKALDKAAGANGAYGDKKPNLHSCGEHSRNEGWRRPWMEDPASVDQSGRQYHPSTEAARQWAGWGTALKPAWESIVLARKPLDGTVVANVTKHGTGALNIDGCRVGDGHDRAEGGLSGGATAANLYELGISGRVERASGGRWPTNLIFTHHCDCKPIGAKRVKGITGGTGNHDGNVYGARTNGGTPVRDYADADGLETIESWQCVDGCPVRALDEQAGERRSTGNYPSNSTNELNRNVYSKGLGGQGPIYSDSGGASRFYPTFAWEEDDFIPYLYCPKASKKDRGEGNTHETVKPNQLMRWLTRLVCPPGGIVFDPFMGSGSTGKAAVREGFGFLGIDDRPGNIPLARRRIDDAGP
jgi:DNA modification methylase